MRLLIKRIDPYFLLGAIVGGGILYLLMDSPSPLNQWVREMDELGLVDQIGQKPASSEVIFITGTKCDVCNESARLVWPLLKEKIEKGELVFTTVNITTNTEENRSLLGLKAQARSIDNSLLIPLFEKSIDYDDLSSFEFDDVLNQIRKIATETSSTDWSKNIDLSHKLKQSKNISSVPAWFVNGKRIYGDYAGLRMGIEEEIEKIRRRQ